ncbi:MAG: MT-A70 family methyltransferase, partial [Rhizobiaceae bacterium]
MTAPLSSRTSGQWPFGGLVPGKYWAILADPPWQFTVRGHGGHGKSPEAHYATMPGYALAHLPVARLAAPSALLVLWATWPHLETALNVMRAWGFTYKTGGAWTKRTPAGKAAFGTGYILRSACEPFLVGTRGAPKTMDRSVRNLIESLEEASVDAQRREHSRKPREMRALIERLTAGPACELFGREPWPGHAVWGDEA